MIKLVRVDHRLIHGQVAFSWTKFLEADCILCASDNLVKDSLKMDAMRLAVPEGVKLVMKNIEDSAKAINSGVTDKYKLFVVCESVEEMYRLCKNTNCIKSVNLGGTKNEDGRKNISKALYLSQQDISMVRELANSGVNLFAQLVPDDTETNITKII